MGLRVFKSSNGDLLLEITAPELRLGHALFVPAISERTPGAELKNPGEFVIIRFEGAPHLVPYLYVISLPVQETTMVQIGELEQTDSINILNHIIDVLAYPTPNRA